MSDDQIEDKELMDLVNSLDVTEPKELETKPGPVRKKVDKDAEPTPLNTHLIEKADEIEIEEDDSMDKVVSDFNKIKDGILESFDDDRSKIQHYIDEIMNDASGKMGEKHIEGVASLMATKVAVSANKIRLLDSMSRLVNTVKPTKKAMMPDIEDLLSNESPMGADDP